MPFSFEPYPRLNDIYSGINRLTNNFELALPIIDDAFRCVCIPFLDHDCCTHFSPTSVSDAEAVSMSRFLVQNDGLFLGSSSACNLVACVKLVRKMGWRDGQKVVTIL
jgi:cysteine synthase